MRPQSERHRRRARMARLPGRWRKLRYVRRRAATWPEDDEDEPGCSDTHEFDRRGS